MTTVGMTRSCSAWSWLRSKSTTPGRAALADGEGGHQRDQPRGAPELAEQEPFEAHGLHADDDQREDGATRKRGRVLGSKGRNPASAVSHQHTNAPSRPEERLGEVEDPGALVDEDEAEGEDAVDEAAGGPEDDVGDEIAHRSAPVLRVGGGEAGRGAGEEHRPQQVAALGQAGRRARVADLALLHEVRPVGVPEREAWPAARP